MVEPSKIQTRVATLFPEYQSYCLFLLRSKHHLQLSLKRLTHIHFSGQRNVQLRRFSEENCTYKIGENNNWIDNHYYLGKLHL